MTGGVSVRELVEQWEDARTRAFLAGRGHGVERVEDYWTELRLGTAIAREVTCGRWCAVASLLRAGAVASWSQVGAALGVTGVEARDGFRGWIDGQVDLYRYEGRKFGLTPAEADRLSELTEAVAL